MAKHGSGSKKIEERAIEVEKGTPVDDAISQVKKMSGFDEALPIKAGLIANNQVEWEFLVGNSAVDLDAELKARVLDSALKNQ